MNKAQEYMARRILKTAPMCETPGCGMPSVAVHGLRFVDGRPLYVALCDGCDAEAHTVVDYMRRVVEARVAIVTAWENHECWRLEEEAG